MHLLVLAAGCFAAVGAVAVLAPGAARAWRPLVPVLAAGFAVAGAVAAPAATGIGGLDAALRAALCGVVVLVGAHARPWAPALAAAVALAGSGAPGPAGELAAAAFGVAFGAAAARLDAPFVNALAAGVVGQAALRLQGPSSPRATAYVAMGVFAILVLAGAIGAPAKPRRVALKAASGAAGLAVVAGLAGLLSAALARPAVEDGIRAAVTGLQAARQGEAPAAAIKLEAARKSFARAQANLDAWWARPALAVPGVARQSRALRTMAASGVALARTGARAVAAVDTKGLNLTNGTVPLDRLQALRVPTREAFSALTVADARLDEVASPWLVSPIATRLATLNAKIDDARSGVRGAMVAFEVAPALLGADGPRHYFLAIQTLAEQRGAGGLIGNFGEIGANGGKLTLDKVGRDSDLNAGGDPASRKLIAPPDYTARYARFDVNLLWQNITMSPDFPTVARAIEGLYPQSGGREVDGVIAIDPLGLAALLNVIGPVEVPSWPVPISGANAAQILLFDQYLKLDGAPRVAFLGEVTAAVWQRLSTTTASVADLGRALGPVVAEKHLMLASTRANEQRALIDLGVGGNMAPVRGDFIGVVTQNAGGNKIDWFLRRAVDYRATLDPATGKIRSTMRLTLRNEAPAKGLPPYVIGSATTPPLPIGTNKTYVSVYSPLSLAGAKVDGSERLMESELEANRHVYSTYLNIGPGGEAVVEIELQGRVDAGAGYRLGVHRQPFLAPDTLTTSLVVPKGWRVGGGSGATRSRSQQVDQNTDRVHRWSLRRAS